MSYLQWLALRVVHSSILTMMRVQASIAMKQKVLTAANVHDITGSAHSRIIQCLKSAQPQAGFDQHMTTFEELAGILAQVENA
eukprot:1676202-Pyramimonas_sp.AAC.1